MKGTDKTFEIIEANLAATFKDAVELINEFEKIAKPSVTRSVDRYKSDYLYEIAQAMNSKEILSLEDSKKSFNYDRNADGLLWKNAV